MKLFSSIILSVVLLAFSTGANADFQSGIRKYQAITNGKMTVEELLAVLVIVLIVLIYFVPVIWVLSSGRSHGGAKFGWFIVAFLFSWLGLAIFLIVTQPADRKLLDRNETSKIYDKEF